MRLVTLEAWQSMPPRQQGAVLYLQGAWPGSELKDQKNPYPKGTPNHDLFKDGERLAVLAVQDGEE